MSQLIAVVETEAFLADVKGIFTESEHDLLILDAAQYPEAGDLSPETGGLRKLRWLQRVKVSGADQGLFITSTTSTFRFS
ncbi:MAG: hypothetical protein ABSG41_15990 [Bryobacteraceae bacterium]